MNYKIRITAENQAIVKRIADDNGMNPSKRDFNNFDRYYIISDNKFIDIGNDKTHSELTTEQFIELFDKKETELDKWLKETKAKNLSEMEIYKLLFSQKECPDNIYIDLKNKFSVNSQKELSEFLFNQWNNPAEESPKVETEWHPKRGDRVLVWDDSEKNASELIFVTKIEGHNTPIVVVTPMCEKNFLEGKGFDTIEYQHMKPLPIEQQTEDKVEVASEIYAEQNATDDNISYHNLFSPLKYAFINGAKWQSEQPIDTDFKTKVIEKVEEVINDYLKATEVAAEEKDYDDASKYDLIKGTFENFLAFVKQL